MSDTLWAQPVNGFDFWNDGNVWHTQKSKLNKIYTDEGNGTQIKYKQKQLNLSVFQTNNTAHWERKNERSHVTSEQNVLTMHIYTEDKITVNKYWTLVGRFVFQSSMG